MKKNLLFRLVGVLCGVVLFLGACSSGSDTRVDASGAPSPNSTPTAPGSSRTEPSSTSVRDVPDFDERAHFSRAESFESVESLEKAASNVVVATPTAAPIERDFVEGTPFDVVEMEVVSSLAGDLEGGETILVRQGIPDRFAPDGQALRRQTNFLLYLTPFVFSDGKDTGQFVPVGAFAGVFIDTTPHDGSEVFTRLDAESPDLPVQLDSRGAELSKSRSAGGAHGGLPRVAVTGWL